MPPKPAPPNDRNTPNMSSINKSPSTQIYRMMLYQRALHPELLTIQDRRTITQPDYELEAWLMPGGHAIRFEVAGRCAVELVTDQDLQLPERGLLHTLPCIGEKEYEHNVDDKIRFVAAVQTENLSDNLYSATFNEMYDFGLESEAMMHQWQAHEDALPNLSIVDLQRYRKEIHAQTYHLLGSVGFILRTQSIFEIA